jgi:hypothetical protein
MTARARWLALMCLVGLVVGIGRSQWTAAVLCLSTLIWILWEWAYFSFSVTRELSRLKISRQVNGRTESTGVLWAGRSIQVVVSLDCQSIRIGRGRMFRDVVSENLEIEVLRPASPPARRSNWLRGFWSELLEIQAESRPSNQVTTQSSEDSVEIRYNGVVRAAGEIEFPGIRVEYRDPMKLFRRDRFIQHQQILRVLPRYVSAGDATPSVKRMNTIPRQGIHRQQRAGVGFELLELREYVEGDPPKSIAWKASARRDKLMTRQYESEVPVRVQLIVDGTASTRIGGYGWRLLDQMTHTAASIAHSVTSVGDAVGAYLVTDERIERTQAISGTTGFYQQMQKLGEFSINRMPPSTKLTSNMLDTAFAVLSERYPELLDLQVNPTSFSWLGWLGTRNDRQRVQIAAAVSHLHGLSTHEQSQLLLEEQRLAEHLGRFLSDCGMPWVGPIVTTSDTVLFQSPDRVPLLSKSLMSAISNAHDNEVFVIIAELLGNTVMNGTTAQALMPKSLEELMQAIGIAKAKHHRVAVICPSPTFQRPNKLDPPVSANAAELRMAAEHIRLRELAQPLQRRLAKMGVPMTITGEPNAMRMVLAEASIARTGRLASVGARR